MSYNDLSILANIKILARVRPVKLARMVTLPCGNVDHEPPTPKAVGQLILQCEPRYWENRVLLRLCFSKDLLVFCIGHSYFKQSGPHLRNQCTTQNLELINMDVSSGYTQISCQVSADVRNFFLIACGI